MRHALALHDGPKISYTAAMTSIRSFLAAIVPLFLTASVEAAPFVVRPGDDNDRMSVIYADAACGAGVRCDRAHIGCRAPGEFFLTVLNLPKAQVQTWMKATKGSATLSIDSRSFAFTADSLDGLRGKSGHLGRGGLCHRESGIAAFDVPPAHYLAHAIDQGTARQSGQPHDLVI